MAYCRVGPGSDVYLYGSQTHLMLHIARNRGPANEKPEPPSGAPPSAWKAYLTDVIPWDHPEAGRTYMSNSRYEMLNLLNRLSEDGVRVPEYAVARLRAEIYEVGDAYPEGVRVPHVPDPDAVQDPEEDW